MIVDCVLGLSGEYKVEKYRGDQKTFESNWFPNIITDNGLDLWGGDGGNKFATGFVGTGNATPQASDASLASYLATDTSNFGSFKTVDTSGNYMWISKTYEFDEGVATGNISELGVGPASNNLFSRALILDQLGNPTVISVKSDEKLRFYYRLRVYQPLSDFTATVDGYDITLRAASINVESSWSDSLDQAALFTSASSPINSAVMATDGSISDVTGFPSGTRYYVTSATTDSYVPGSHEITGQLFWDTADGNGTLSAFQYKVSSMGTWQFSVSPAITKESTQRLTIGVRIRWAREGEL